MNIRPLLSGQVDQFLPDFVAKVQSGEIDPLVDHVLVFARSAFAVNDLRASLPPHLLSAMEMRSSARVTGWFLELRPEARKAVVVFLAPELPSTILQGSSRFRSSCTSDEHLGRINPMVYFGPSMFHPFIQHWRVSHFDGPFSANDMAVSYLEHATAQIASSAELKENSA